MYSGAGFSDWEIGDITVYIHNGEYHLFHLIIPNHDYIAHATSKDGLAWRRTKNAIFVGDPGEWDDDMLWTMHVFSNENKFFYPCRIIRPTALSDDTGFNSPANGFCVVQVLSVALLCR